MERDRIAALEGCARRRQVAQIGLQPPQPVERGRHLRRVGAQDVHLEVADDLLTITAARGKKKYRKEVLLPGSFPREKMRVSCTNGVLEIRCVK